MQRQCEGIACRSPKERAPSGYSTKENKKNKEEAFYNVPSFNGQFIAGKRGREGMGHGDRPAKDAREQTTDGERAEKALLHLRPSLSIRGRPGPPVTTETYMIM